MFSTCFADTKLTIARRSWRRSARFCWSEKWLYKGLDIFLYRNILLGLMARAATTSDAFNAVAEPRRREILNYLALQERPVGDIVASLGLEQPSISKHLRVLRDVGLV